MLAFQGNSLEVSFARAEHYYLHVSLKRLLENSKDKKSHQNAYSKSIFKICIICDLLSETYKNNCVTYYQEYPS